MKSMLPSKHRLIPLHNTWNERVYQQNKTHIMILTYNKKIIVLLLSDLDFYIYMY